MTLSPEKIGRPTHRKTTAILVNLSAEDYANASVAARINQETLGEWISNLVNLALKP